MTIDTLFRIPERQRNSFIAKFIEKQIVGPLPGELKDSARQRTKKIVNDYLGRDVDALSVLKYAAERGRFEEFAKKLEAHYQKSLQYVDPMSRIKVVTPGAKAAETFFLDCYRELGFQPSQQ